MPYLDGLPPASSVSGVDIVAVDQGGSPGVPGTATTRKATLAQLLQLGTGPVTGPGSSVDGHVVAFNGTTGSILEDSGVSSGLIVQGPTIATSGGFAVFDGTSGRLLKDAGISQSSFITSVATISTLRALSTGASPVWVDGFSSPNDGGEGMFLLGSAASDNGGTIIVSADGTYYRQASAVPLSTKWFGAKADGTTDDTAAIAAWWAVLIGGIWEGYIEGGSYKLTAAQVWNLSTRRTGIRIRGAGQGITTLDLSSVTTGVPFTITGSGVSLFYGHFSDFTISTSIAGVGCALGVHGAGEALNGFTFRQMEFKNEANNSAVTALQLNGCFNCDFATVTTNTGGALNPPQVGGSSNGKSLHVTRADFCRFMGSFSGAETGIYLTGEAFSNVFEALDVEVCNRAVNIDSAQCQKNTFMAGTYVAATLFDFTAGSQNVLFNPNPGIYAGGAVLAGIIGLYLMVPGQPTATPSLPATGVPLVNTTGQIVLVVIAPGSSNISQVEVNTAGFFTTSSATVILQPGDSITLIYTTGIPYMLWQPVV